MRGVRLTHSGGPTVLIEVEGWRLLTDPTLDAPGRRYSFGWGARVTRNLRFSRALRRAQLGAQVCADEAGVQKVRCPE